MLWEEIHFFFHNALKLQYLRINQQVTETPELHKWVPLLRGLGHQPTCWLVPFVTLAQRNTARRYCLSKYNFGQCQCNVTLNLSNKHSHRNLCIWIQAKGYFGKCIFWKERWSIVNLKQYKKNRYVLETAWVIKYQHWKQNALKEHLLDTFMTTRKQEVTHTNTHMPLQSYTVTFTLHLVI